MYYLVSRVVYNSMFEMLVYVLCTINEYLYGHNLLFKYTLWIGRLEIVKGGLYYLEYIKGYTI